MVDKWEKLIIWFSVTFLVLALVYIVTYPYYLRDYPMHYEFDEPQVEQRNVSGQMWWNVTLTVTDHEERDTTAWDEMSIRITGVDGMLVYRTNVIRENDPTAYDDGMNGPVRGSVWFIDRNGNNHMETGDSLIITGLGENLQGTTVVVRHPNDEAGVEVGRVQLPDTFL